MPYNTNQSYRWEGTPPRYLIVASEASIYTGKRSATLFAAAWRIHTLNTFSTGHENAHLGEEVGEALSRYALDPKVSEEADCVDLCGRALLTGREGEILLDELL